MQMQQEPTLAGTTILVLSSDHLSGDTAHCRALGIALHQGAGRSWTERRFSCNNWSRS